MYYASLRSNNVNDGECHCIAFGISCVSYVQSVLAKVHLGNCTTWMKVSNQNEETSSIHSSIHPSITHTHTYLSVYFPSIEQDQNEHGEKKGLWLGLLYMV